MLSVPPRTFAAIVVCPTWRLPVPHSLSRARSWYNVCISNQARFLGPPTTAPAPLLAIASAHAPLALIPSAAPQTPLCSAVLCKAPQRPLLAPSVIADRLCPRRVRCRPLRVPCTASAACCKATPPRAQRSREHVVQPPKLPKAASDEGIPLALPSRREGPGVRVAG
jgi:hypothetical protein